MPADLNLQLVLSLVDKLTGPLKSARDSIGNFGQSIEQTHSATGKIRASVWVEQQQQLKKAAQEAEIYAQQISGVNAAIDGLAGSAAAFVAARAGMKLLKEDAIAGATAVHNSLSMATAGYTLDEVGRVQKEARKLSGEFKLFTRNQIEEQITETTPALGTLDHAIDVQEKLLKLRTILEGQNPGSSSAGGLVLLVKALEEAGAANNLGKFNAYLEQMAKLANAFKGTIREQDWYGFFKRSGSLVGRSLDLDYVSGAGATYVNTVGGDTAGVAQRQFYQEIVGSFMQKKAAKQFVKLGMVSDDSKIIRDPDTREVLGLRPGAIDGQDLAKHHPYRWIHEVLDGAFKRAGLTNDQRDEATSSLFPNPSARGLIDFELNNRARIEKDMALKNKAHGLDAANTWANNDPTVALKSAQQQFENTKRAAGEPLMGAGMSFFHKLGAATEWWNDATADKPWATPAAMAGGVLTGGYLTKMITRAGIKWAARTAGLIPDAPGLAGAADGSSAILSNVTGATKGILKAPWDITKGLGEGAAAAVAELPAAARAAVQSAGKGLILGVVTAAGEWAIKKGVDAALPTHGEAEAKWRAFEQNRGFWARWKDIGDEASDWMHGRPEGTSVAVHNNLPMNPAQQQAAPQVDASQIDAATAKATEAGQQMTAALNVTAAPRVDLSGIDALLAKIREAAAALTSLGAQSHATAASIARGAGVLHDGYETH